MTACLRDESLQVRRTTLVTLIHLLQEDYLKMSGRGAFFFRIVQVSLKCNPKLVTSGVKVNEIFQTLLDDMDEIKHLATFYLQQRLLKRKPNVMYQHFIESIFHYNEYEGHETYNKFAISEREKRLFSLKGDANRSARRRLYRFMLENMNDEHRFQLTYRLCQDVLNGVVEGQVVLDGRENSFCLLQDALACLASEEIKLASLKNKPDEDEVGNEEDAQGAAVVALLRKNIISQTVKKNYIENIIPIVIALKHKLEELKSPLIDDLMTCLRELMKDYKNEVCVLLDSNFYIR